MLSWIDGHLTNDEAPVFSSPVADPTSCDPKALSELGCFTTVRAKAGQPTYLHAHLQRLQRDACTLGLVGLDLEACRRALLELAAAGFTDEPNQQGIIRLTLSPLSPSSSPSSSPPSHHSSTRIHGTTRPWVPLPSTWRAVRATSPHPGPHAWGGAKLASRALYDSATQQAVTAHAREALFFDEAECLIEGSLSNLLFVLPDGTLATPPLKRGPVAGIARELCLQHLPTVLEYDLKYQDLPQVLGLFAINAVRGAVRISHMDDVALGSANSALSDEAFEKVRRALRWEEGT